MVNELMITHFPECEKFMEDHEINNGTNTDDSRYITDRNDIDKCVSIERIRWAMSTLAPYKSAGEDGIFPALILRSIAVSAPIQMMLFRASIIMNYIPESWRGTHLTFIPKPGEESYDTAKSYRPISLMSFVLKILEKSIDRKIRETYLGRIP